jgi:hypothetical protein
VNSLDIFRGIEENKDILHWGRQFPCRDKNPALSKYKTAWR